MTNNEQCDKFCELAKQVSEETGMMSSPRHAQEHEAVQEIIKMGIPACQYIVDYWATNQSEGPHFFYALRKIIESGPHFPKQLHGRVDMLEGAWASWLLEKGLIVEKEIDFTKDGKWRLID